jgi:inosine-uridine nucleoside N-ribohydrolase
MGGGINMGNVTGNKHAEYNFFSDAEAASIVLHSNLEVFYFCFYN